MNFIVVQDRYEFLGRSRTVEELKEVSATLTQQYYSVSSRVLAARGVRDHSLCSYRYDRKYE